MKLFDPHVVEQQGSPGEVLKADSRLLIAAGSGAVEVEEVQPAGKPRMRCADWVRGRGVKVGQRFAGRTPRRCRGCTRSPTSASPGVRTWTESRDSSPPVPVPSWHSTRAAVRSPDSSTTIWLSVCPSIHLPVYS